MFDYNFLCSPANDQWKPYGRENFSVNGSLLANNFAPSIKNWNDAPAANTVFMADNFCLFC